MGTESNKTKKLDKTSTTEQLSNEELVSIIQKGNCADEYWCMLYKQTEESIYSVYHKKVHAHYKANYKDDILSILKIGWAKAVKTFDNTNREEYFRMCIKTVKSIGLGASVELLKDHIRDLDMGKMLAVAGGVLEADPKAFLKKFDLRDEDVQFAVKKKLNLVLDFMQWPFIFVTGKQPWTY